MGILDLNVIISSTYLIGNKVSDKGGAFLLRYSGSNANSNDLLGKLTLKFENVDILSNTANQIPGFGAGVLVLLDSVGCGVGIGVINSNISSNVAHGSGGGLMIVVHPKKARLMIVNCTFVKNRAGKTGHGGALAVILEGLSEQTLNLSNGFILDIENSEFLNNIAAEGGAIFQEGKNVQNSSGPLFLNIRDSKFKCCEDDIAFESQNGTFIFSSMTAYLEGLAFYENAHVADRPCTIPGVMIENYVTPKSIHSINYFCVSARVLLEFNKKLIGDVYTNVGYLNGEKVTSYYSISIACSNCQNSHIWWEMAILIFQENHCTHHEKTKRFENISEFILYKILHAEIAHLVENVILAESLLVPITGVTRIRIISLTFSLVPKVIAVTMFILNV